MKRYKCKKQLMLDAYDDDGFAIENEVCFVEVGDIYETCEDGRLFIACKPAIRLENSHSWIEIYPETLAEHFEEITDYTTEKGGEAE